MTAEKFWSGWLKITTILVTLGGIVLIILYNMGEADFLDRKIDRVFFDGQYAGVAVAKLKIWMVSLTGSLMSAWGLTMLYLVNHAFKKKEKWAWRSIFYPLLLWYLIDSTVSAYYAVGLTFLSTQFSFYSLWHPSSSYDISFSVN